MKSHAKAKAKAKKNDDYEPNEEEIELDELMKNKQINKELEKEDKIIKNVARKAHHELH